MLLPFCISLSTTTDQAYQRTAPQHASWQRILLGGHVAPWTDGKGPQWLLAGKVTIEEEHWCPYFTPSPIIICNKKIFCVVASFIMNKIFTSIYQGKCEHWTKTFLVTWGSYSKSISLKPYFEAGHSRGQPPGALSYTLKFYYGKNIGLNLNRTWTEVQFKVQQYAWTGPLVQFSVQQKGQRAGLSWTSATLVNKESQ